MSAEIRRFGSLRLPCRLTQSGVTLVELMVSMALGLFVVMAATGLLVSTKSTYVAQDDAAVVHETGRYALEAITRAVRQAAYENWDARGAPVLTTASASANITGLNAARVKATSPGLDSPLSAVNGSDVLAIRFFGSGDGEEGDGTMLNCAGFSVAATKSHADPDKSRGWSIFYVSVGPGGEPELYCKFLGKKKADKKPYWSAQAIARGVESFHVLYGLDTDVDGLPNRFLNAAAINKLDQELIIDGADEDAKNADRNRKTNWKKVVVVKVALLVRGALPARADVPDTVHDLFGYDYANKYATVDPGVRIDEADFAADIRRRTRRIFSSTIHLRNQSSGSGV